MRQTTIFAFDPLFLTSGGTTRLSLVCSRLEHPAKLHHLLRLNLPASDKHMTREMDGRTDRHISLRYVETGRQALDSNMRAHFHRS